MKGLLITLALLVGCGRSAPLGPGPALTAGAHPDPSPATVWKVIFRPVEPPGAIALRIWDASGRQVRAKVDSLAAGIHEISWDGRTDDGLPVGRGVYFYQIDISPDIHWSGRWVVVR